MIQVLVQVAAGSGDRKIYNERTLEFLETRRGTQPYPYPYGFIVGTSAEDGGAVDCYIITKERLEAGATAECEPIGLLEQHEGDEIDHKILAALSGQQVEITSELLKELQDFIYAIFAHAPEIHIRVGPIHARETAVRYLQGTNLHRSGV